jgi:hypothetical protein
VDHFKRDLWQGEGGGFFYESIKLKGQSYNKKLVIKKMVIRKYGGY